MQRYLTSNSQAAIVAAESKISVNCGFPDNKRTERWAIPQQSVDGSIWFIPEPNGYKSFTKEQMMDGVDLGQIVLLERNPAWFPKGNEGV